MNIHCVIIQSVKLSKSSEVIILKTPKLFSVHTAAKSEKSCIRDCRRSCKQIRYNLNLVGSKMSIAKDNSSVNIFLNFKTKHKYFRMELQRLFIRLK